MKKKYVVVLGDGMADYPDPKGNTPLTEAFKPTADKLAKISEVGLVQTIPEGLKPGSDTANLSVMGFDPTLCYTGRSPLEAVSIGITLAETDVTYRCNLVTLSAEEPYQEKTMVDYSAGEISTAESKQLIETLAKAFDNDFLTLYSGISYRHCLVRKNGKPDCALTPPHDISGKKIGEYLPKNGFSETLFPLMLKSYEILKNHPVNVLRRKKRLHTADSVWFWGEGTKPRLEAFYDKFGVRGAVISAVDLIKGIAISAKMESIDVVGATGTLDTNFEGKAKAAIEALKTHDLVYVHLEAPDECGHQGDRAGKIKAIERIDEKILTPIFNHLTSGGQPFNLLFVPDHATPLIKRTHTSDPVPYLLYNSDKRVTGAPSYDEFSAKKTGVTLNKGTLLMQKLLERI